MFTAALLIKVLNQKLLVSTNRMEKIKYGTGRQEKNTQKYR